MRITRGDFEITLAVLTELQTRVSRSKKFDDWNILTIEEVKSITKYFKKKNYK